MPTAEIEYCAPRSLPEALALLAEREGAVPLAGGTDVVPGLKYGVLEPCRLVSLGRIPGLAAIAATPAGDLEIGALATLRDVAASPLVRAACPALAEAAAQAGSPLLRNRGTLGGNLCLDTRCWYYNQTEPWRRSRALCLKAGGAECYVNQKQNRCVALFSADTPAALLAAEARVTLASADGERTLPVEALYTGDGLRPLAKAPGELVTRVTVPASPRRGTAYLKWSVRESIDFPVLGVAAAVALAGDGRIARARVAVTGATPAPLRLAPVEAAAEAVGAVPEPEAAAEAAIRALGPLFLAEAVPHKRRLAGLLAAQALERAAAAARAGATA